MICNQTHIIFPSPICAFERAIMLVHYIETHIQFVLQTVPEAREESDHEMCPPPKVISSNVQNTTTE